MQDWGQLTPGMIIDLVIQYNNEMDEHDDDTDTVIEATQSNFDRF